MPRRLYFSSTAAAPITPPAADAAWLDTGGSSNRALLRTKDGSALTTVTRAETSTTDHYDILLQRFVSEPLEAQTISGTVYAVMRARETDIAMNASGQLVVKVINNDGTRVKATLLAHQGYTTNANEWPTTQSSQAFPRTATIGTGATLTSYACAAGDRLLVEVGAVAVNTVATSYSAEIRIGAPAASTDFSALANTSDLCPWLEFSQDVKFLADRPAHWVDSTFTSAGTSGGTYALEGTTSKRLSLVTQPAGAVSGSALTTQPVIQINPVAAGVVVTASVGQASATLSGAQTATTDAAGRATFSNLTLTHASPPVSTALLFTAPGYAAAMSGIVSIAAPAGGGGGGSPPTGGSNSALFPNAPAAGNGWTLVGEERDWNYTSIPFGYEPDNGSGIRDFAGGYEPSNHTIAVQANAGATTVTLTRPPNMTLTADVTQWAPTWTVNSTVGWAYMDMFRVNGTSRLYPVGDVYSATSIRVQVPVNVGHGAGFSSGASLVFVTRFQPGMQVIFRQNEFNIFDDATTNYEVRTIASVTDTGTNIVLTLTQPLQYTYVPGKGAHPYFGKTGIPTTVTDKPTSLTGRASGKILRCNFHPMQLGGGQTFRGFPHQSVGLGPRWNRWDPDLCNGTVYFGCWVRYSANFTLNGNIGVKRHYLFSQYANTAEPMAHHFPIELGGYTDFQPQSPNTGNFIVPNEPRNYLFDGNWHLTELLLEPNSGSETVFDGRYRCWVDGRLELDVPTAAFTATQVRSFDTLSIDPIFGAGLFSPEQVQYQDIGPLRTMVYTTPPSFPNAPTSGYITISEGGRWALPPASTNASAPNGSGLVTVNAYNDWYEFVDVTDAPNNSFDKAHRFKWPTGLYTGGAGGSIQPDTRNGGTSPFSWTNQTTNGNLYVGLYVKLGGAPRWSKGSREDVPGTGARSGGFKWGYIHGPYRPPPQDSSWISHAFLMEGSTETEPAVPSFLTQFDAGSPASNQYSNATENVADNNQWNLIEYKITANTFTGGVPNADGVVQIYVNGVLRSTRSDALIYQSETAKNGGYFELAPIYGATPPPWPVWCDFGPIKIMAGTDLFPNAPVGGSWVAKWNQEFVQSVDDGDYSNPLRQTGPLITYGNVQYTQLIDVTGQPFNKAMRVLLPPETGGGGILGWVRENPFRTNRLTQDSIGGPLGWCDGNLYFGCYIRIGSTNGQPFTLSGNPGQKFFYFTSNRYGDLNGWTTPVVAHAWTFFCFDDITFYPTYIPQFNVVPTGDTANSCATGSYGVGTNGVQINDGQWHLFECLLKPNTHTGNVPNADGELTMWMDGVQLVRHLNVIHFCYGQTNPEIGTMSLEPIYGAGTNPPIRECFVDYGRMLIKVIPD